MTEIILILGGARSGKSSYGIQLAKNYGHSVIYLASGVPCDEEMKKRIKRHIEDRPESWQTVEEEIDIDIVLANADNDVDLVLFDDLSFWVSNLLDLYQSKGEEKDQLENKVLGRVRKTLDIAQNKGFKLIIISNEVGMSVVPKTSLGRIYRDILGRANQLAASQADRVFLMVAGLPIKIKEAKNR